MHRYPDLPKPFADLGLELPLLRALKDLDYKEPTPIQRELIPHVLCGKDVLGQARTGTGKTAAFGLPILQQIDPSKRSQALLLTPTRELAVQVLGEIRRLSKYLNLNSVPVYGGTKMSGQLRQLGRRPHLVVGTPGRVLDMYQRGALMFDEIRFVVLDEVDRMLDIGFRDEVRRILSPIRHPHQTIFVSATLEDEIRRLAARFMTDPVSVNVSRDQLTVDNVIQHYCVVEPWDKFHLLKLLFDHEPIKQTIIFTRTKHGARKLARRLHAVGIDAREIHGDLIQQKRERIMDRFRKHHIPILVATDLASRGIDVQGISHIINFDMPDDIEVYVHRIGRTARMGASGKAISFVTKEQGHLLTEIEMLINQQLEKIEVPGFHPSPPPRDNVDTAGPRSTQAETANVQAPSSNKSPKKARSLAGKFPARKRRL